ncbi:MAG: hypothetical protein NVS2B16_13450 [Chloroflexota bacterium]
MRPTAVFWQPRTIGSVRSLDRGVNGPMLVALLASATLFYAAPWPLVYVPAILAVLGLSIMQPVPSLALVPLFAPFFMQPKHLGPEIFPPSELFLLVVVVAVLSPWGPLWREPSRAWSRVAGSPVAAPLALLLVAGMISTVLAADRHHALEWLRWTLIEPAVYFALLVALVCRTKDWYLVGAAVIFAGFVVAIIGLVQYQTHQNLGTVPGTTLVRLRSVYGSPDNVGLLLDRALPLLLAVSLVPRLHWVPRTVLLMAGTVMTGALVLSASRGAEVAVLVAFLVLAALRFPAGRWIAVAIVGIGALVVVVRGPALARTFQFGHQNTVSRRLDLWRSSVRMVRDHPLVGIGPDNFLHYYAPRTQLYIQCDHGLGYMEPGASQEPCLSHPHNELLDFYLSTGLAGLVAFIWLLVVFWRLSIQSLLGTLPPSERILLAGVMAAMLASNIHGLVDNSYFLVDLSILFWSLVGYVCFVSRQRVGNPDDVVYGV